MTLKNEMLENAADLLSKSPDFRVLRRVAIHDDHVFAENSIGEACARLAVIDTETTGLKIELGAKIIDLGIVICEYGRETGTLYRVVDSYEGLEDPELPIPAEITQLTGITDEMVRGKRIDDAEVARVMDQVSLVICHNARFDRAFLEQRFPAFTQQRFACSLHEVPWSNWQLRTSKLDYLGFRFGLFHDGHRARADVDMLTALLAQKTLDSKETVLSLLLASARAPSWRINAFGLPFESKDLASARGYRWSNGQSNTPKAWWIETRDEQAELDFLAAQGCAKPEVIKLTALNRYRS